MLKQRVLSAIVLIPIAFALLYLGGWWYVALIAVFGLLAGYEAYSMLRGNGYEPLTGWGLLLIGGFILLPMLSPQDGSGLALWLTVSILLTLTRALFHASSAPATDWALTVGIAFYVGTGIYHATRLRLLPDGLWWVVTALLLTWITDSGAYFIGTSVGRHRMAPRLSPKKTWEGTLGGGVVGILAALLLGPALLHLPWTQALILGLAVAVVAPVGDLAESMFKRQCGVKDSGHWIPGHGGAFDRIDSLLFVFPTVYWLAVWWTG